MFIIFNNECFRHFQVLFCYFSFKGSILTSKLEDDLSKKTSEVEELRASLDEARYNVSNIEEKHSV